MRIFSRLMIFFSLILFYLVFKEMMLLFNLTYGFHPYLGYFTIVLIISILIYFAIIPILKIILLPVYYSPTDKLEEQNNLIKKRLKIFEKNKYLIENGFIIENQFSEEENYNKAISILEIRTKEIHSKYVNSVMYSSAISQNGFIDALILLSSSVNLVKDIFILYQGRVNYKNVIDIFFKILNSVAIGGSEIVEKASEEIFAKLSNDTLKSIPFAGKLIGSVTDGFVNATLVARVGIITENYCKMTYLKKPTDLYPNFSVIYSTTMTLTSGIFENLKKRLKEYSLDKISSGKEFLAKINPFRFIMKDDVIIESENKNDSKNRSLFSSIKDLF